MEADRGKISDRSSRSSSDAEALETEPAVRSSIPISPIIVETRIKPKSKAPTPQSKTALPHSGKPTLPTFRMAEKGILGNPVQYNRFTGDQMPTLIKPVEDLVPKVKEQNFRMRPQRKCPLRQQHGRKGKCPTKAQPVPPPSANLISDHLIFLTSRLVPDPSVLPNRPNSEEESAQNETSSEVSLKCLYANCLSLTNKLPEIKQLAHDKIPYAMAFTETWLTSEYRDSEVAIPGFSLIRTDSSRGRYGGVAIYFRNDLPPSLIYFDFPAQPMADTLWLRLPLRHPDALLIGPVYWSPFSDLEKDYELLKSIRDFILSHHCSHLLLLDEFNAPEIIWDEGVSAGGFSSRLFHLVQEEDWTQHVREPTRYRAAQRPSLLDLLFTNESHLVDRIQISEPLGKKDHAVLEFDFLCYWTCKLASTKLLRNFSIADFTGLSPHLAKTIHLGGSVNELFVRIQSAIYKADLKYIPRRPVKQQSATSLLRRIRRLLDGRVHIFAKQRYTQSAEDIAVYRKVHNQCRNEIQAHQKSIQTRVSNVARQNKSFLFKYMRCSKKNKPLALLLKLDETSTTEAILIANGFRDYFVSVYTDWFDGPHPVLSPRQYDTALYQVAYGVADVWKLLKQVSPYSAMGPDYIHPRILKEAADTQALPLFSFFHDSLSTVILPAAWKEAHVTPVYESGDCH